MRHITLLLIAVLGLFSACDLDPCGSTPERFVTRSDEFFAEVETANLDVGDADWSYYDERFRELVEDCYPQHEEALNSQQEQRFWNQVAQYYVDRYGRAAARQLLREGGEGVQRGLERASDWIDGVLREAQ